MARTLNSPDHAGMVGELRNHIKDIREAMEFYERLVIFKTNRHHTLSSAGYEPIVRQNRENFVDYALRVRAAFPSDHALPRLRIRGRR